MKFSIISMIKLDRNFLFICLVKRNIKCLKKMGTILLGMKQILCGQKKGYMEQYLSKQTWFQNRTKKLLKNLKIMSFLFNKMESEKNISWKIFIHNLIGIRSKIFQSFRKMWEIKLKNKYRDRDLKILFECNFWCIENIFLELLRNNIL